MNIENKETNENGETYDKKLLLNIVKRILMIGEKDRNISLQSKYNKLDERLEELKKKDEKFTKLLSSSALIKTELNEKLSKLNSLNESIKENLLEMVE